MTAPVIKRFPTHFSDAQLISQTPNSFLRRPSSMPRKLHDSFVKEWMQELLTDFGTVETEVELEGEVCTIGVLFYPDPQ